MANKMSNGALERAFWTASLRFLRWIGRLKLSAIVKGVVIFLSVSTVHFLSYCYYFSDSILIYYDRFAFANFIFVTGAVFLVSLALSRILLFFLSRYLVSLLILLFFTMLAILDGFLRVFDAIFSIFIPIRVNSWIKTKISLIQEIRERALTVPYDSANEIADSFPVVYIFAGALFSFLYLGGSYWVWGVVVVMLGTSLFYFVFVANLLFLRNRKFANMNSTYLDDLAARLPESLGEALISAPRALSKEINAANEAIGDWARRVLLLGLTWAEFKEIASSSDIQREFFVRLFAVMAICISIPFGFLRAQQVIESSIFSFHFSTDSGVNSAEYVSYLNSAVFYFLWSPSNDELLVVPFETGAIAVRSQSSAEINFLPKIPKWRNSVSQ